MVCIMGNHYGKDGRMFEFCIDTGTPVSLLSEEYRLSFLEHCRVFPMANGRRLRCGGIGSGELLSRNCIEPTVNMRTISRDELSIWRLYIFSLEIASSLSSQTLGCFIQCATQTPKAQLCSVIRLGFIHSNAGSAFVSIGRAIQESREFH